MRPVIAFALLLSATTSSLAATVTGLQGQVLINTGDGFRLVQGSIQAGPGANVIVNQGAQASIQYDDGCSIPLPPGQLYTIAATSPCPPGQKAPAGVNGLSVGVAIVGGAVGAIILLKGLNSASP